MLSIHPFLYSFIHPFIQDLGSNFHDSFIGPFINSGPGFKHIENAADKPTGQADNRHCCFQQFIYSIAFIVSFIQDLGSNIAEPQPLNGLAKPMAAMKMDQKAFNPSFGPSLTQVSPSLEFNLFFIYEKLFTSELVNFLSNTRKF